MPTSDLNGLVTAATSQTLNLQQKNVLNNHNVEQHRTAHTLMRTAESLLTVLVCHKSLQTAPQTTLTAYPAKSALTRLLTNAQLLVIIFLIVSNHFSLEQF